MITPNGRFKENETIVNYNLLITNFSVYHSQIIIQRLGN